MIAIAERNARPRKTTRQRSQKPTPPDPVRADLVRRADALLAARIDFIPHPDFAAGPPPAPIEAAHPSGRAARVSLDVGLAAYVARLYETELLDPQTERQLFLRLNYVKYRAEELRQTLRPRRPSRRLVEEIERLLAEGVALRNQIVRANLRLIVSIARRFVSKQQRLDDLISEGHLPLIRAVELFDASRGYRFSTYGTWAVRNHFVRALSDEQKLQTRYAARDPQVFELTAETRTAVGSSEAVLSRRQRQVAEYLGQLDPRERRIVMARFGLANNGEPSTLSSLGRELCLSKERVRQLEMRALDKIRRSAFAAAAGEHASELP